MDNPKQVTVQEIVADTGAILQKISSELNDHEQRLQMIELTDLDMAFILLRRRIARISDHKKQEGTLQVFKEFCNLLGVSDLELTQP